MARGSARSGKRQKTGVYARNGEVEHREPARAFVVGRRVRYLGTHKDFVHGEGVVVSKRGDPHRSGRSTVKVLMPVGKQKKQACVYIHKHSLALVASPQQAAAAGAEQTK